MLSVLSIDIRRRERVERAEKAQRERVEREAKEQEARIEQEQA